MEDMIERVARALAMSAGCRMLTEGQSVATREFGWDIGHKYTEKYVEAHWKEHVHAAGFALEAMKEPTAKMIAEGESAASFGIGKPQDDEAIPRVWQWMVAAALSPTESTK